MASISELCNAIIRKLRLAADLKDGPKLRVEDEIQRFNLWVNNIGGLHQRESRVSVESRLRNATDVLHLVSKVLQYILDAANKLAGSHNGATSVAVLENDETSLYRDINAYTTRLFRISRLIRDAPVSDLFQKALRNKSDDVAWSDQYDINYVGDKFPKLANSEKNWLQRRLGHAITQRRQYLSYVAQHKSRLARATDQDADSVALDFSETTSSFDRTQLHISKDVTDADTSDDIRSESTLASFIDSEVKSGTHSRLPKLSDLATTNQGQVECLYCPYIGPFSKESSWQRHVYADLRAYVCTFEDCNNIYFRNINDWFAHELRTHRSFYCCRLCANEFSAANVYLNHVNQEHPVLLMNGGESALLSISRKAPQYLTGGECPLCADLMSGIPGDHHIPLVDFKRHVANHLEELSLFALPSPIDLNVKEEGHVPTMLETSPSKESDHYEATVRKRESLSELAGETNQETTIMKSGKSDSIASDFSHIPSPLISDTPVGIKRIVEGVTMAAATATAFKTISSVASGSRHHITAERSGDKESIPESGGEKRALGQKKFIFRIDEVDERSDAPNSFNLHGGWVPIALKGWNVRRDIRHGATGSWWLCDGYKISRLISGLPVDARLYSTTSMFYAGGHGFWVLNGDATNPPADETWHALTFNHGEVDSASLLTHAGTKRTLRCQPGSSRWPAMLFPDIYHGPKTPSKNYGGLTGNLSILLGLIAFSVPPEDLRGILPGMMQDGRWITHDRRHGRTDKRGVVVNTCTFTGGATAEDLQTLENGGYGAYYIE